MSEETGYGVGEDGTRDKQEAMAKTAAMMRKPDKGEGRRHGKGNGEGESEERMLENSSGEADKECKGSSLSTAKATAKLESCK